MSEEQPTAMREQLAELSTQLDQLGGNVEALKQRNLDLEVRVARLAVYETDYAAATKSIAAALSAIPALSTRSADSEASDRPPPWAREDGSIDLSKAIDALLRHAIDLEIEPLVGTKITPAERDDFVDLAMTKRAMFERMIAARQPLNLMGRSMMDHDLSSRLDTTGGDELGRLFDETAADTNTNHGAPRRGDDQ